MENKKSVAMEYGSLIIGIMIFISAIGFMLSYVTKQADNPVEQAVEEVIEAVIEETLGLESGTIEIDLTPKIKETYDDEGDENRKD